MKSVDIDEEKIKSRSKSRDKNISSAKVIDNAPCFQKGSFFFGAGAEGNAE